MSLLVWGLLLSACSVYDEGLADWWHDAGGGAGGSGGIDAGKPGGEDSGNPGTGVMDAQAADAAGEGPDGEQPPAPGCVAGEEFCLWICPELCDGRDNDCDGKTDEDDASESCDLANASADCVEGECAIAECQGLHGDCDGENGTGCETLLDTLDDCGACGVECTGDTCAGGICTVIAGCGEEGLADCDEDGDNGCETLLYTLTACGACGKACVYENAASACDDGSCEFVQCIPGFGDCDDDLANGCERSLSTLSNCGACAAVCDGGSCAGGSCTRLTCQSGLADCDGDGISCETSLRTEKNCGMCGAECGPLDNATASCWSGACEIDACDQGYDDCDGLYFNGCESSLLTNQNCGECAAACGFANAVSSCASGACELISCDEGFDNCDKNRKNGCETDLNRSVRNCGICNNRCEPPPHASAACIKGKCGIGACDSGWADCGAEGGCETLLGTVENCLACGHRCLGLANVDTVACESGACVIEGCSASFDDCNNTAGDGCEIPLGTETDCAGCGDDCTKLPFVQSVACEEGSCAIESCAQGFEDCTAAPGCESSLGTTTVCSGCGHDCTALPNTDGVACNLGTCEILSCDGGWDDCNDTASDGCETRIGTETDCGGCNDDCTALPNTYGVTCNLGTCEIVSCDGGWDDCNDTVSDGCETELGTVANCAACGDDCSLLFQVDAATCGESSCAVQDCNGGWDDCNDTASDGCETTLDTTTDCNGCGVACARDHAAESCPGGVCTLGACDAGFGNCDGNDTNGCETAMSGFDYTPSNFSTTGISVNPCPSTAVVLGCGTSTFNSQTLVYGNWCSQTQPTPIVRTQTDGPDVVIIPLSGLTVASGSTLRLTGDRPVILTVFGDASIAGSVDVGSDKWTTAGAGGNWSSCGSSNGGAGRNDTTADDGASGGGGGGFGSAGGHGGQGFAGDDNTSYGVGGIVGGDDGISPLRGGCRGGQGGKGWTSGSNGNARGGYGGGALQISVSGTLSVAATAVISAAGGGGEDAAGADEDGGAGGGSGGALLLEAWSAQIAANAWLTANGGGGSEGGDTWDGSYCAGTNGYKNSDNQAPGGAGGCGWSTGRGGDGGFGAAGPSPATEGGFGCCTNGDAGGGGGGGVGRIRIRGANQCAISGNSSPAASTACP